MEAGRRQPGMLQGLSRFLVQHERCGAGFDVAHPAGLGSGRVSITCRGCGARHEYATATIDVERELSAGPVEAAEPTEVEREARVERAEAAEAAPATPDRPTAPDRPAIPPRPAPYPDSTRHRAPERRRETPARARRRPPARQTAAPAGSHPGAAGRGRAAPAPARRPEAAAPGRFLGSPAVTLALAVIAAAALAFALVRTIDDDDGGTTSAVNRPQPQAPAATPAPAGPGGIPDGSGPAAGPAAGGPPAATSTLRTERYTIDVPTDWSRETADGGLLLEPPGGGRVNVQIYYENSPQLSAAEMARATARFLTEAVPGAATYRRRTELGGERVYEVTARGPGETAIAVDVLRGPYRYLLVRRIFAGAKPHVSQAAGRIVLSFEPR